MPTTQRVLSGSRTRGSTATPSGSIIYSYQGIYAKSDASYFGSLLPRIGSGDRTKLYKGSKPAADTPYDDSLVMNNDTSDMGGEFDAPVSVRISFDLERMTLGQAPTTQQGDKFVDINRFEPVTYLQDPGEIMWPVNLWNLGSLPDHEYDGVIEALDIRSEILGTSGKYSGHKTRGAIMGSFADTIRGGREILDVRRRTAEEPQPFFDGPAELTRAHTIAVPVAGRLAQTTLSGTAWTNPYSALPLQAFQGLYDEVEAPFVEKDQQNVVYSRLNQQNPRDFIDLAAGQVGTYELTENWSTGGTTKYTYTQNALLKGWWRMKTDVSSTGDMPDSGDNNFDGTFAASADRPAFDNSAYPGSPNTYIADASADFNGSANFMKVDGGGDESNSWNALIGGSYASNDLRAWSFSCWVYVDDFSTDSRMFIMNAGSADYANSAGVAIQRDGGAGGDTGTVSAYRYGGGSWVRNSAVSNNQVISEGAWHHIVVTYAGTFNPNLAIEQFNIYVDGVSNKSSETGQDDASDAPTDLGANYLYIGASPSFGGRDFFNGKISDCAIWSVVLTQDSVSALYAMASAGPKGVAPEWVPTQNNMDKALRALSKAVEGSTDPLDVQTNHGFYFGKKAGSIVYGDW